MKNTLGVFTIVLSLLISHQAFAKFTYEGHLSDLSDIPLLNQAAIIRVSILGPFTACIVFQETHSITTDNKGFFSIQVGAGIDVDGLPNVFDSVFNNDLSVVPGMLACSYTSTVGDHRRMQIEVSTNAGVSYENLGTIAIGKAPQATHADTISGFDITKLLRVSTGTAPVLNSSDVTNLTNLISGTSSLYIQNGSGVTNVTALAPLIASGGTTPNISILQANSGTSGFLSSSDWSVFSNKQNILGFAPLNPANNLNELPNMAAARTNLGLGNAAVKNFGTIANTIAEGNDLRIVNAVQTGSIVTALSTSSSTSPAYTFSSNTNTGIFSPGTNVMGFSTAGLERIKIDATGYVGIGTSAPGATLDVNGHIANSGPPATLGTCSTAAFINGNDTRGLVNLGAGDSASCIIIFNSAFSTAPFCVVSWQGPTLSAVDLGVAANTTSLTIYFSAPPSTGRSIVYHCLQ